MSTWSDFFGISGGTTKRKTGGSRKRRTGGSRKRRHASQPARKKRTGGSRKRRKTGGSRKRRPASKPARKKFSKHMKTLEQVASSKTLDKPYFQRNGVRYKKVSKTKNKKGYVIVSKK